MTSDQTGAAGDQSSLAGKRSRMAASGFVLAVLAILLLGGGAFGARLGLVPVLAGLGMFSLGGLVAMLALPASLIGLYRTRRRPGRGRAVAGAVIALVALIPLARELPAVLTVPPIHDITTDTDTPPQFTAVVPLRGDTSNSLEYGGAELAAVQRKAYPEIVPLLLDVPPAEAFARVQRAAAAANWVIVADVPAEGRLEATEETRWFGFKDDVVVRVRAGEAGGSRVDMRSVSRVGKGDSGVNARRIRQFLTAVAAN